MENSEFKQDFTSDVPSGLTKSDEVLIKSSVPVLSDDGVPVNPRKRGRPKKADAAPLSVFETAFVNCYLDPGCGYNSKTAVVKAGYPEKGSTDKGKELMADVRILQALELGRKKMSTAIATSRNDMMRKLELFLAISLEKKDVVAASRILALELDFLGMRGVQRVDLTGDINIRFGGGEVVVGTLNPDRNNDATDIPYEDTSSGDATESSEADET